MTTRTRIWPAVLAVAALLVASCARDEAPEQPMPLDGGTIEDGTSHVDLGADLADSDRPDGSASDVPVEVGDDAVEGDVCGGAACGCPAGRTPCLGECVVLDSDPRHCGGCNQPCALVNAVSASCSLGACVTVCEAGFDDCNVDPTDGCEANLTLSPTCGSCDESCTTAEQCLEMRCQCTVPFGVAATSPNQAALATDPESFVEVETTCRLSPATPSAAIPVVIRGEQSGRHQGSLTLGSNWLRLQPTEPFLPGEKVTVTVTADLLDEDDQPLPSFVWQFWVATNVSDATFSDTGLRLGDKSTRGIALADLDGDDRLDVVASSRQDGSVVYLSVPGAQRFAAEPPIPFSGTEVALADINADGVLDLVGSGEEIGGWWTTNNNGYFAELQSDFAELEATEWAAPSDVDADGDLDVFVLFSDRYEVGFSNGTSLAMALQLPASGGNWGALGDLDGDGDLDAFILRRQVPDVVWFNDGQGRFTAAETLSGDATDSVHVALGDLDGDGDLDAIVANYSLQADTLWINDGSGHFTDGELGHGGGRDSMAVALGDLDGDGDLDAFFGQGENSSNDANRVLLNDGAAQFTDSGQRLGAWHSYGVALGDLDNDGDLDAFVGNWGVVGSRSDTVWINE